MTKASSDLRESIRELMVDVRIVLSRTLKKLCANLWVELSHDRIEWEASLTVNEHSCFVKVGDFLSS
jgi:hypothetical protein